jgi:tetratricopeptide (TPR) repeat protein
MERAVQTDDRRFAKVFLLMAAGNWPEVRSACKSVLSRHPADSTAKLILASAVLREGGELQVSPVGDDEYLPEPKHIERLSVEIARRALFSAGAAAAIAFLEPLAARFKGMSLISLWLGKLYLRSSDLRLAERNFERFQREATKIAYLREEDSAKIPTDIAQLTDALRWHVGFLTLGCDADEYCDDALILLASGQAERAIALAFATEAGESDARSSRTLVKLYELLGKPGDAKLWLHKAVERFWDMPDAVAEFAGGLARHREFETASDLLRKRLAADPRHVRLLAALAEIEENTRSLQAWRNTLETMKRYHPDALETHLAVGNYYCSTKDYHRAIEAYRRGAYGHGDAAEFYEPLGNALLYVGELEPAVGYLTHAACYSPDAWGSLVSSRAKEAVLSAGRMEALAENPLLTQAIRTRLSFGLAHLHDALEQHDVAYRHIARANRQVAQALPYPRLAHRERAERNVTVFTRAALGRLPRAPVAEPQLIFICGLPRSGTTLVEQILASHPAVHGAGELRHMRLISNGFRELTGMGGSDSLEDVRAIHGAAERYRRELTQLAPTSRFVIDKTNSNYLHLGLITLMFPNAKIIKVTRDYRDVAISLYFADFDFMWNGQGKKNPPLEYSFEFEAIVEVIKDYRKLMDHWNAVLPLPILEVQYEKLIQQFETVVEGILSFVGLEKSDEVYRFHDSKRIVDNPNAWNVRQPLYNTSVGKWRKYRPYLPQMDLIPTA